MKTKPPSYLKKPIVVVAKKEDGPVFQVKPALDIAEQLKVKVVSDRKINFSEKAAYDYLELATFQGERQVNERHVQFLYNAWVGGRFMWGHVILALCVLDGRKYRINGQHTCWMRVNLDPDFFIRAGEEPQVREITYQVDSEDQMRALYSTFDQNKSRTQGHVLRALLTGTPQASDLWPTMIPVLGAGIKHWLYEANERWLLGANDLAALVADKYESLFKIVGLYIQQHYNNAVFSRRAGVVGALFATFEKAGGKAPEFWDPVCDGLNLTEKTDPRYVLRDFLKSHGQTSSNVSALAHTTGEDTYRICILAWNKWRKGEKQKMGYKTTETRHKAA